MSISKQYVSNEENIKNVLHLYLEDDRKLGYQSIADELRTRYANVLYIVNHYVDGERKNMERSLRMSRSKLGNKNPMLGKTGETHPRFKGLIGDGHGYVQRRVNGKYQLEHRRVMAQALGLEMLPSWLDVHHIDKDKQNNSLDNLALVTPIGHGKLHHHGSPRLPLWEQWQSGTLKLPKTTRISLED